MADDKAMYYHLSGRMATVLEALEATTGALVEITEKLKLAQQATEDMFRGSPEDEGTDSAEWVLNPNTWWM